MQPTLTKQVSPQVHNHCGLGVSGVGVEDVGVLVGLGLTGRQARVYLALLKTGDATAKVIAHVSLVNRQDIHRVINSLQQAGLIQRKVTHPTTFQATPIADVLGVMLQQKTNQLTAIREKTRRLTEKYGQTNSIQTAELSENPCLGIISEGDHGKKHRQAIENAQHAVDAVITWKQFRQATTLFEAQLKGALKKHAAIRVITEKPPNQSLPNWVKLALTKKPCNLKLKTLTDPPTATLTIFDSTQAAIALNNTASFTRGPHLWTNNPTILALSQAYFNVTWTQPE